MSSTFPPRFVLAMCAGAVVACKAAPRESERVEASAPVSTASAAPVASVEEPLVQWGFDAGGQIEIDVPTVACPVDGMIGRATVFLPPTMKVRATKELLALDNPASQLRVYASEDFAMLGPPGWRCHGWSGSSGADLALVPGDGRTSDAEIGRAGYKDEVVRIRELYWSTSGRFRSARLASRVFPSLRAHARAVRDGWYTTFGEPLSTEPFPGELLSVEDLLARYEDPPGVSGLGTEAAELVPNDDTIRGTMRNLRSSDGENNDTMVVIAIRLRAERDILWPAIRADFEERTSHFPASSRDACWGLSKAIKCLEDDRFPDPRCP